MGQINCQCQYSLTPQDKQSYIRKFQPQKSTERTIKPKIKKSLPTAITKKQSVQLHLKKKISLQDNQPDYFCIFLKNKLSYEEIKIRKNQKKIIGTDSLADGNHQKYNKNLFKTKIYSKYQNLYVKDCGMGLGTFIQKRKFCQKNDGSQIVINVEDYFVMVKLNRNGKIQFKIYDVNECVSGSFEGGKNEIQIEIGNDTLLLNKIEGQNNFYIELKNKKTLWLLTNPQRKIKKGDVLRFGTEIFTINDINSEIDSNTIIQNF